MSVPGRMTASQQDSPPPFIGIGRDSFAPRSVHCLAACVGAGIDWSLAIRQSRESASGTSRSE